jgi:hypothetical protein
MSPVAPEMKKKIKIQGLEKGFKEENLKKIGPVIVIKSGYPTFFLDQQVPSVPAVVTGRSQPS